jgi:putative membrane protein insertion efficiency factor
MFAKMLIGIIGIYKRFISPHMPNRCRFYPTCSDYSAQAIEKHGAVKGSFLALKRLSKCHPLHPGGVDYVPESKNAIPEKEMN